MTKILYETLFRLLPNKHRVSCTSYWHGREVPLILQLFISAVDSLTEKTKPTTSRNQLRPRLLQNLNQWLHYCKEWQKYCDNLCFWLLPKFMGGALGGAWCWAPPIQISC